jgi:hypothetical protein
MRIVSHSAEVTPLTLVLGKVSGLLLGLVVDGGLAGAYNGHEPQQLRAAPRM